MPSKPPCCQIGAALAVTIAPALDKRISIELKDPPVETTSSIIATFLPFTLTTEQAKWFTDYRRVIMRSEVYLINVLKDENNDLDVEHIEEDDTGISPVNRLYKEVKNKTVKQEEVKVKKYGNK